MITLPPFSDLGGVVVLRATSGRWSIDHQTAVIDLSGWLFLIAPVVVVALGAALVYARRDATDRSTVSPKQRAEVACLRARDAFESVEEIGSRDDAAVPEWRDAYRTYRDAAARFEDGEYTEARRCAEQAFDAADALAADAISDAHAALEADNPGADRDRARQRVAAATDSYETEAHADAWLSARRARMAADPDPDRLLEDAERLAESGFQAFQSEAYERATERWTESRDRYRRVLDIARSRGDAELADRVEERVETASDSIGTAERERAERRIAAYTSDAAAKANDASDAFDDGEYRTAAALFEDAADDYGTALQFASERGMSAAERIETARQWAHERVVDSRLRLIETELDAISSRVETDPRAAIDEADAIRRWIDGLELPVDADDRLDQLSQRARIVRIRASTAVIRELMDRAESRLDEGETAAAHELYETARSKLSDGLALTERYDCPDERETVRELIDTCRERLAEIDTDGEPAAEQD